MVRKVKLRVRADSETNNHSTAAATRRTTLSKLQFQLIAVKAIWTKQAKDECNRQWQRLLAKIAVSDQKIRWKAWHRTVPSGQRSLNSITNTEASPVPHSLKESLNNFSRFYSQVMSASDIPSWMPPDASSPPPSPKQRSADFSDTINSFLSTIDNAITTQEVKEAAKYLRKNTAPGPDNIPSSFISNASPPLITAITNIFNFSWQYSAIPNDWKKAYAFAIFKKGNRSDPSAYRLISITSIIIRLFERIVNNRISSFLESNSFFSVNQAGFRKHLSTLDNIYRLLRDCYSQLSKGKQLPIVFLDIVKAFDRVPHDLLLFKLHTQAGLSGKTWGWLKAYLTNRFFRVTQLDQASDWFPASAGVPQGGVLSPQLFAIYINDLDIETLNIILSLFADDGAGWPQHVPRQSYLSQYKLLKDFLTHVQEWSEKWELDFSLTKTQILLIVNKQYPSLPRNSITLQSHNIEFVDQYKYLGLIFQSNGKWNRQFDSIVTKAKLT
jgi:hypothetical protein